MENDNKSRKSFLKLEELFPSKDFKPKSLYDLKMKIKDSNLVSTVKFLIEKIKDCDIDPDIYFALGNTKDVNELAYAVQDILYNGNSRKYDDDARNILLVVQFLLDVKPTIVFNNVS